MYIFSIITNNEDNTSFILPGKIKSSDNNDTITFFYTPKKILHPSMKTLYLYSSNLNSNHIDYLSWNSEEPNFKNITKCFVFTDKIDLFNTYQLSIKKSDNNVGLNIKWGSQSDEVLNFWIFKNPKNLRLYPLAAIIWPPAQRYADDISKVLGNHYQITHINDLFIPKQRLSSFVKNIYKEDLRCDKSQLPWKCRNMYPYTPNIRYIRFLVGNADLNTMKISKTAIKIKELIRKAYRDKIPNYVHDIIFHISDNASHARSMEKYVSLEIQY